MTIASSLRGRNPTCRPAVRLTRCSQRRLKRWRAAGAMRMLPWAAVLLPCLQLPVGVSVDPFRDPSRHARGIRLLDSSAAAARTEHGCSCKLVTIDYTADWAPTGLHVARGAQWLGCCGDGIGWCDVEPGCAVAQGRAGAYGGWDACIPGAECAVGADAEEQRLEAVAAWHVKVEANAEAAKLAAEQAERERLAAAQAAALQVAVAAEAKAASYHRWFEYGSEGAQREILKNFYEEATAMDTTDLADTLGKQSNMQSEEFPLKRLKRMMLLMFCSTMMT